MHGAERCRSAGACRKSCAGILDIFLGLEVDFDRTQDAAFMPFVQRRIGRDEWSATPSPPARQGVTKRSTGPTFVSNAGDAH
jgi:hypothetical protein